MLSSYLTARKPSHAPCISPPSPAILGPSPSPQPIRRSTPHDFRFPRQVIAICLLPELLEDPKYPEDVKERARTVLKGCKGGSLGSYSDSPGIEAIRRHIADYIEERDGFPSHWEDIVLCAGASEGIRVRACPVTREWCTRRPFRGVGFSKRWEGAFGRRPERSRVPLLPVPSESSLLAHRLQRGPVPGESECPTSPRYRGEKVPRPVSCRRLGKSFALDVRSRV